MKRSLLLVGLIAFAVFGIAVLAINTKSGKQAPLSTETGGKMIACANDNECIAGINTSQCCGCPQPVHKNMIGSGGWQSYEPGKDYTSQFPDECKAALCQPCASHPQPMCSLGKCVNKSIPGG